MVGPLAYIGGKNRLAKTIISLLPEHTTYVEAFAGGCQVLFHKAPSHVEVINDLDFEVVNFFRVCQWHYEELLRYLKYCLMSRKLHQLHLATKPETLTDIQRAGRFYFLQKTSFGGLVVKQHYHYGITHPPNYNPERIAQIIEQTHRRLARVQIEALPYQEVLDKYDKSSTCFYLDPPYWQRRLYRHNFAEQDFIDLERRLHKLRGRFILSLDDHPAVRKLFCHWNIMPIDLAYSAQKRIGHRYAELLIMNFKPQLVLSAKTEYENRGN